MKNIRLFLIVLTLLSFNLHFAQEDNAEEEVDATLETGNIAGQFEYLAKKSGNYRALGIRYEVVKVESLDKLKQNVLDSLQVINSKTAELKAKITENEKSIDSLNAKLGQTQSNLSEVKVEKDTISFLGIPFSKATYSIMLWVLITGLFLLLLFFIYKFRNSNILTQEAKTSLAELEKEYEDHRRRALEREQKISRQYQDEINKNKKSK